jgi:non-specific serine/threonine protein kinase
MRMIGQVISHYRIATKLGEGGMGAVYRAEDQKLHRAVALKFLPAELIPDAGSRQRILHEARVAARLNHPHIATIYEVGETAETPYIAMEFVEGVSLKDLLARGRLADEQVAQVAREVAEGLREAHQSGVLHRDIKPGNVIISSKQGVKILDFGLSVLTGRERKPEESTESFVTRTVTLWSTGGTVPYMSPEQLRGEPTDARGDIFSYGVVLYECLTGRLPFSGKSSVDIMHAILHQPPTPLRTLVPDISPDWERFVDRCLAKSAEKRFRTMEEVVEYLPSGAVRTPHAEKSVAVLYFEHLGGAKDDEYFRDGMTEDVITELSKIKELRTFPRSAVLPYRDKSTPAPQVGEQLNADYVVEGSLRRAGNRLRITAQLVEARTGHALWGERYDRQMEDVFAIQDEIAHSIARALRVMLTEQEKRAIQKAPTTNIEAYDYYLRGRQHLHQFSRKALERARRLFIRAYELDPDYAGAYAGVAGCCALLFTYFDPNPAYLQEADEASRKALELDPELAEAHVARGITLSLGKRFVDAQAEFEAAIRQNPGLYEAYYFFARACFAEGRKEEAARLYEEAWRVRPDDYVAPSFLASVYRGLGRTSEAHAMDQKALQAAEKHLELFPDEARALYLGAIQLVFLGNPERGLEWAERALQADPEEASVLYNVACVFSLTGKTDRAIKCLDDAVTFGWRHKQWIERDSDLDSLRGDPRFQAILARL